MCSGQHSDGVNRRYNECCSAHDRLGSERYDRPPGGSPRRAVPNDISRPRAPPSTFPRSAANARGHKSAGHENVPGMECPSRLATVGRAARSSGRGSSTKVPPVDCNQNNPRPKTSPHRHPALMAFHITTPIHIRSKKRASSVSLSMSFRATSVRYFRCSCGPHMLRTPLSIPRYGIFQSALSVLIVRTIPGFNQTEDESVEDKVPFLKNLTVAAELTKCVKLSDQELDEHVHVCNMVMNTECNHMYQHLVFTDHFLLRHRVYSSNSSNIICWTF